MTQHEIFWVASTSTSKTYLNKPLPEKTDVVVIGGGFTGTSAALQLAKGGAHVTLLEAQSIGWGASSRNGGQALSCLHYTLTKLIKQTGQTALVKVNRNDNGQFLFSHFPNSSS